MRTHKILFGLMALLLISCAKDEQDYPSPTLRESSNVIDNKVTIVDVLDIVEREFPASKATARYDMTDIVPVIGAKTDTLLYIVNYKDNGGWKIYSSDKRTPAIIAEGSSGRFSLEDGSPAVYAWMEYMKYNMERISRSTDAELSFSKEEIALHKSFWTGVDPIDPNPKIDPSLPIGHWEESISAQTVEYDHVDHLVAKWDQAYPYNECCPYLVSDPSKRAYTGCVAIAGSQMLYYLHNKIGVPESMYGTGTCVGNINTFTRSFDNLNSNVWSSMSTSYRHNSYTMLPEAIMISYVGMMVNMHYCNNYSWALPGNLKSDLFEYYGIHCSKGDYDENIVKTSLLNEMPVIVTASDLMVPVDGDIHTFVIDGYRRTRTKYTHHHYYVIDVPGTGPYVRPEDYDTYTYSSPQLTSIKINWGWSSQWTDDINNGWYSLTSGWAVTNGGTYTYNHNLSMIHGFSL